jgi:hypothetical protein
MPAVPLADVVEPSNILYFGDGGTGKTTNLLAMARLGKIWVANLEGGVKARALRTHGIPIENIEVWPDVRGGEEFSWEGFEKEWLRIRAALKKDPDAYAGVGVDSVTEMQQKFAGIVGAAAVRKAANRGVDRNPSVMDQDNWREANWYVIEMVRRFRDLPCHFGMTALHRREVDQATSKVSYVPSVSPSVQTPIIGHMDLICYCEVAEMGDEEEFQGRFTAAGAAKAKDRWRAMPKGIVDPTFDRVVQYVDGDLTVDTDIVMDAAKERRARFAKTASPEVPNAEQEQEEEVPEAEPAAA